MKQVLWLASWYPNKLSPYDGDFLQRHAKAVSLFCKLHVIYIVKDETGAVTKDLHTETAVNDNLTEQVIYYAAAKTGIPIIDRALSQRRYVQLYKKAVTEYIEANDKPAICHVQIALKAGLAALWIKRKWNIPYVVSEQWTGYLGNADHSVAHYSLIQKRWLGQVLKNASAITVVSDHLGKSMQKHFPYVDYRVIPNVVDTNIFSPALGNSEAEPTFIHISNMNYQKNTEAILKAFSLLKNEGTYRLQLFGTASRTLIKLIGTLELTDRVMVRGEVPQTELALAIQRSDALILYSRFETFGCVLIEANACGVPVIVSDIEVFHELVREGENGMFAKEDDPAALAATIRDFSKAKKQFNNGTIALIVAFGLATAAAARSHAFAAGGATTVTGWRASGVHPIPRNRLSGPPRAAGGRGLRSCSRR